MPRVKENFLIVGVDIQLKQVVSCQFVDVNLVPPNLILKAHALLITTFVKLLPKLLYFLYPNLMGSMGRNMSVLRRISCRNQMFKSFHY